MRSQSLRHRAPLLWLVLPYMGGLWLGRYLPVAYGSWSLILACVLAGVGLHRLWRGRGALGLIAGALVFCGAGVMRVHWGDLGVRAGLPPREVVVTLRCERILGRGGGWLAQIEQAEVHLESLEGVRVFLRVPRAMRGMEICEGDRVELRGVFTPLQVGWERSGFEAWLRDSGVHALVERPSCVRVCARAGLLERMRRSAYAWLAKGLGRGLAERRPELAGLYRAVLLGRTQEVDLARKERFARVGVMHLFAVSGLHIVVLAGLVEQVLAVCRLPLAWRLFAGLGALSLYVWVIGAPPSAMRAWVMIACLQAARQFRLGNAPISGLSLGALLTLVADPLALFGAGFQMSYLIVGTIFLLGMPLSEELREQAVRVRRVPDVLLSRWMRMLRDASESFVSSLGVCSAIALTSLLSGVAFMGSFVPGALFVNLIMVPLGSLVVNAGGLSLLFGMLGVTGLVCCFNYAAGMLLMAMDAFCCLVSEIPGMGMPLEFRHPLLGQLAVVLHALLLALGYHLRWGRKRRWLWLPFAWVPALLLFFCRLPSEAG